MHTPETIDTVRAMLVDGNYLSAADFDAAAAKAKNGEEIVKALQQQGTLSPEVFGQAAAEYYKMPFLDVAKHIPTHEMIGALDEDIARKNHIMVVGATDTEISLATDRKPSPELVAQLNTLFPGKKVAISYALGEKIDYVMRLYTKALSERFDAILKSSNGVAPEMISQVIVDALSYKVSDIHIEPYEKEVVIRFRIDGVLSEAGRMDKKYYENVLNRIKVDARLRIDEHLATQDGSLRFEKDGLIADLRVSIVPTVMGEKVVLRVLSRYVQALQLSELGMSDEGQQLLQSLATKPFGMIMLVGPTGAGKTTTLYALLKSLTSPKVNVTTIEDPVEYRIEGINQIQVREEKNLTFANGLRSIVRQDPDIILVGEIRDQETADIAVNAALTGHLLLSTFHANDAATAFPRLIDMGVEPFLLASTLEAVIAQRLVRRICPVCRYGEKVTAKVLATLPEEIRPLVKKHIDTLYHGHGCDACSHTGYYGRIALFEIIPVTDAIEQAILTHANKQAIADIARAEGSLSMFEDGLQKVKQGVTTIEEVIRVVGR